MVFSPNVQAEVKGLICQNLGGKQVDSYGSYLGMPFVIGRNKNQVFRYLINKVAKCIKGWKANILSKGGKVVLLRTVSSSCDEQFDVTFPASKEYM